MQEGYVVLIQPCGEWFSKLNENVSLWRELAFACNDLGNVFGAEALQPLCKSGECILCLLCRVIRWGKVKDHVAGILNFCPAKKY